ncbi:spore gernimation protein [Paenibacillus whitsoniae]|uniref:Spore gernimation protein n=2 Tax=Paenibacillus whitsoniae TaxID=2496558 RepID=A0A3S0CD14_9BACL|nr:spore gernimation protein [Paenibacillus whitsoniae]
MRGYEPMFAAKKITAFQLYCIFIISIAITNHVLLIPVLLQFGKRDAWIGAAAALVPILIYASLVYVLVKRTQQQHFLIWMREKFNNRLLTTPLRVAICLIAYIHASVSLRDVMVWTKTTYLPNTPMFMISSAFMLFCFFAARVGLRAIAISTGILLPLVVILGYFVMGANFQYKDYSLLTPLFTHGYRPALTSMYLTCGASFEMLVLIFLQHHASTRISLRALLIISVCILGLTIGPLTGAIAIFGPFEAADLRYPAFEQWRMVTIGKYISHLDFLSIFQWISGACIRTSALMFLMIDIWEVGRKRTRTILLLAIAVSLVIDSMVPISDNTMISWIQELYYPSMFIAGMAVMMYMLVVTFLPGKRKEEPG